MRGKAADLNGAAHGSPWLRAAGLLVALGFRVVPRQLRFRAAIALARLIEPIIRRTYTYECRNRHGTDGIREICLELILMVLTRYGTSFDPIVDLEGVEQLPSRAGGPLVVISPHTMLSILFLRYLEDTGYEPLVITPDQTLRTPGTRRAARVLCPSASLLLQVRRHFKAGHTIAAMIDRGEPERRSVAIASSGRTLHVSEALVKLAIRHDATVLFLGTKMTRSGRVVSRLARPSHNESVGSVLADFVQFVETLRSPSPDPSAHPRDRGIVAGTG
jgi:hypothetical protein